MQHPRDHHFAADPDMEVELSAQDLIGLTPVPTAPTQQSFQATLASTTPVASSTAPAALAAQMPARTLPLRILGAASVAIIATLAVVALVESAPPQRIVERPVSNWSPVPDPVGADMADVAETPTLMANPFDASEVFELPPGLSQDQARAMVAELLLQRASERRIYSGNRS